MKTNLHSLLVPNHFDSLFGMTKLRQIFFNRIVFLTALAGARSLLAQLDTMSPLLDYLRKPRNCKKRNSIVRLHNDIMIQT